MTERKVNIYNQAQLENLIEQIDDAMGTLAAGRVMESPALTNNISRLGIARTTLLAVLEGTPIDVALVEDELNKETIVRFDANIPVSEQSWWRYFRQRESEPRKLSFRDHIRTIREYLGALYYP